MFGLPLATNFGLSESPANAIDSADGGGGPNAVSKYITTKNINNTHKLIFPVLFSASVLFKYKNDPNKNIPPSKMIVKGTEFHNPKPTLNSFQKVKGKSGR